MQRLGLAVVVLALGACSSNETKAVPEPVKQVERQRAALVQSFAAGSLIVPMDIASQDMGTLRAFGLIDRLLRVSVPVHRIVKEPKAHQDIDMSVPATDRRTSVALGTVDYRSSPFVIAAADATPSTLAIVDAYLAANTGVNVHVATADFTANEVRTLVAAPRISALRTGNQAIIYNYLNAAGIQDANGNTWSDASPGAMTLAQLAGPTLGGALDGALMSGGLPAYDQFTVVHYQPTGGDPSLDEMTRELRGWLTSSATNHAHLQCSSALVFENNAAHGRFLTNLGIGDVGGATDPVEVLQPLSLYAQYSGTLQIDPGDTKSFDLASGSTLYDNSSLLVGLQGSLPGQRMNWLTGYVNGNTANGKISYLGGHSYSTTLPISANPRTNGVRLFLNGLFETPALFGTMQPTLALTKTAPAFSNSTTVTFTINYSNTGPGVAYASTLRDALPAGTTFVSATGGGTNSSGTVSWALGDLAPGASGSVSVTLTAPQGTYQNQAVLSYRVGITPKTFLSNVTTTVVDTTAPVASITGTPSNPSPLTTATFTFTANEPATFQCSLDGAAFTACTSPTSYTALSEASHTFAVRAVDTAGNVQATPASYTWTVDLTAPGISFISTPAANTNTTSATFAFSVTGATTVECQLNSGGFAPCTSPFFVTGPLADGSYTFTVRATDAAGNVSTLSYEWVIDTVAPSLAFTATPGSPTNQPTANFAFTVSGASAVQCSLDGAAFTNCTSPVALAGLADGNHTFRVRASDLAGNTTTISHSWLVNTVAPTVTITSSPSSPTTSTSAAITFTVSSVTPIASTECRLNAGAFTACTSPVNLSSLADGSYTFTVRATDTSNNVGSANALWVVDTTNPVVTFTSTPANPSNLATGDIDFTVSEPATVLCRLNAGAFAACASPFEYASLTDGSYTLRVQATDGAGNVGTNDFTWVVDLTPPTLAFSPTPPTLTNQATLTAAFTVGGASTVQCSLDGAAFVACTSPFSTPALTDGSHTLQVRATDAAGNVTTISHTWTVDLTAPSLAFTTTPPNPSALTTATFAWTVSGQTSLQCRLDSATFAACGSPVNLAGLTDGSHTYEVQAADAAGNLTTISHTWVVDTVPPDITFNAIPSDPSNSASASIAFTVTGGATSVTCSLDGAAFAPCTSPVNLSGLSDATHTFSVRAADAAGNTRTTTHTWRVDTLAPNTTFDATPAVATSATTAAFSFSSTEAGTFECSLDGAAFAACLSPTSLTGLAEGSHTYRARAIDAAGNVDASPASFTWTVDTTAPTTTLLTTPAAASNTTTGAFTFSSNEGTATFECSVDGGAFTPCTSPFSTTPLAEGSHTFAVRAVDAAGNTDATPASFTWTVDVTPPDTTLSGPSGTVSSTNANFTVTSAETATFQCSLDGAPFTACSSTPSLSGLTEGSHTFQARAVDTAGNVDPTPASRTWTVDVTDPTTTITAGPTGFITVSSATFEFESNEFGATFQCSLDGAPFTTCSSPLALSSLAEGSHTFAVRAVDAANNLDATPATRTFTVDTIAPDTTLVAGPTGAVSSTSATFGVTSNDATATFECDLDGAGFVACPAMPSFSGLAQGPHTLVVRAVDPAGNRDASPATRTWTVDTLDPDTTIDSGPTGPTASAAATFGFSSSEATVTYECSVDGATFAACANPLALAGLAEGAHTLAVRAVDAAGNRDPSPATRAWTVDTVVPDTTLLTAPSGLINVSTATFTFESNEAGVTFECSFDAEAFAPCTSPVSRSAIFDGAHTFRVRARDAAGNVDATPATATWTVDAAEPDTLITAGPTGAVSSTSATFEFQSTKANSTFECSLDGATFAACSTPSTFTGLAQGSHTLQVRARDAATNVDPTPASRTWTVDTIAPETTVVTRPAAVNNSPSASIDLDSNEAGATYECSLDGATFTACSDPATFTGLADGLHVVLVRAVDAAGNRDATPGLVTWTVDTVAPDAPRVLQPVAGSTTSGFPGFGGTAEPGSTVTVTSGGTTVCTAVVAADGSWSCSGMTAFTPGMQTVTATATDPAGNTSPASPPLTFTVATGTPETVIRTGPSGLVASTSADFTVAADRSGVTFECSLDGAPFAPCSATPAFTGLSQGAHHFEVRAVDGGTRDPSPATRDWTVDTIAPAAPVVTAPAANATTSATPLFAGTAEAGSTVVVTVDGQQACTAVTNAQGAFSCAAPSAFAAGSYTVTATATDPARNTSVPSAAVPFTVDASTLDTAIIAGPSGTVRSTSATFAFAATVLGATFECSLDGAAFSACPTPTTFASLAEGSHTLEVRAVNGATTDPTPATRTWTVDSVAPMAPVVLTPANNATVYTRTPRYTGTAEANSTVRVSVDDRLACVTTADAFGAWSCSSPTELASGEHRVAAVAVDAAGNVSPTSAVNVFTVDIPTVSVRITSPADDTLTGDNTPTISGTTYPGATVTVFVDGVNVGTTTADGMGNWAFTPSTGLADGSRVVTAQAQFMGHQSPTSSPVTVRIDTTPPVVTLTIDQAEPVRMPAVGFTANESPVTWECSVDGAPFTACESPLDVSGAGEGPHTVTVRATDEAGNTGSATGSYDVVVPSTPPVDLAGELAVRGGGCGCGATDGASTLLAALALLMLAARRSGRRLRRLSAGPAVLGLALASGVASAQAVAGFDLERLDLNPGATASLITQTGDVLKKGGYRVSLTGHYQHDSLLLFRLQTNERLGAIVGSRVTAHVAGAWAPLEWLELGLQLPIVLWQGGDDLSAFNIPAPATTALGTPWLTGRFALLREAGGAPLDLAVQLGLGLPFGTAAAYSNATPLAFAPRVGAGKKVLPWLRVGAEVGVLLRGAPPAPGNQTVSQAGSGSALTYGLSATTLGDGLRGELSLRGGAGFDAALASAELLIGARYPFAKQFEVYAIGGPGFGTLPGSPAFRVLAGVAWQPPVDEAPKKAVCTDATPAELLATTCPELDSDGDGVKNGVDACPRVVGVEGRRGCPVPDTDGDGLTDDVDVCPKEPGLAARRGCPVRDMDNDGLEDDQDECPAEAGPAERKGCPVRDRDQDGVEDDVDACPAEAGPAERKGCPFKDQDGDTVEDALDNCPTEKGDPANAGCPKKQKQLVVITAEKLVIKEKVFFATGKSAVLAKSFPLLDNVAQVLNAHPEVKSVRIEGHTDSVGKRETNLKLSQDRADSVKEYLMKKKVDSDRLKAVGFGPDVPVAPNDTAAGREQNRRVEFNFETGGKTTTQEVPATP